MNDESLDRINPENRQKREIVINFVFKNVVRVSEIRLVLNILDATIINAALIYFDD